MSETIRYNMPEALDSNQRVPFLARHPWVGYLIFLVCGAAFIFLSLQVVQHGPLTQWDQPWSVAIHNWAKQQSAPVTFVMRFFSSYGRDGVALIALILTIGWVRRKARRPLQMLFFGVLGGELWFQAISNIVNRTRPAFKDPFETLIGPGYPSGHAATNVLLGWLVLYLLLPHIRSGGKRLLLVLAVIFVVAMVCISRLFLGLHYVTDIAGGLLLGFAWGGFIYTLIDVLHYRRRESAARAPGFQPAVIPVTTSEKKSED